MLQHNFQFNQLHSILFVQFYDESDGENISELLNNLKDSECKLLSTLAAIETLEWEEARQNNVSLENNKVILVILM